MSGLARPSGVLTAGPNLRDAATRTATVRAMTCEVISNEGACKWPVAADGLCLIHLLRRLDGFTDDELGLPLGTRRPPKPERLCEVVMDTGELCGRPQRGRGLCNAHWARRYTCHWPDERMGEPFRERGRTCEVVMDDGQTCARRHYGRGLCRDHWYRQIKLHWPDERMGEPFRRGRKGCDIVMDTGEACPGMHCGRGLCRIHYVRRHVLGWPDERMGEPIRDDGR